MSTLNVLKWYALTAAVNEMKSPNKFVRRLLWTPNTEQTLPVEDIELSVINKARETAPFVRKNGEGIMVPGYSTVNQTISGPNIRIKRPFTPSELLYNRQPGTVIFVNAGTGPGGDQASAIEQHIARDMQVMADLVTNTEELMCCQALTGTVSYSLVDQEVFTITFPKPSGNNITLTTFWNDATPANVDMLDNFHTVKKVMSDEVGLIPTDCLLGSEASAAFRKLVAGGYLKAFGYLQGVQAGNITFVQQFNDDGAIYLGELAGIRVWEYSRTVSVNGVATPMIRAKYAEFVTTSDAAQRKMYYAAIPDMKAMKGRLGQMKRFSKSWETEDPSAMMALLHSRPFPVPRRPGAMVSMKVVSG